MQSCLFERLACPQHKALQAQKRKKGRPNRKAKAEMKLFDAIKDGQPIVNDQNSDLAIAMAMAFSLICHHWGFTARATEEALGKAALKVLGRTDHHRLALSGDGIRKIVQSQTGIAQSNFRKHFKKRTLINWRPLKIRDYTNANLLIITQAVLEAGGHSPHEWEDLPPII